MPEQEALVPGVAGLWRQVLDANGNVDRGAWLRIRSEGGFVGSCTCGGYLVPRAPEQVGKNRTDYAAECRNAACAKEICAPGGRLKTPGRISTRT